MHSKKYLFVIGRPGSGKSTVVDIIVNLLTLTGTRVGVLNDWSILNRYSISKIYPKFIQSNSNGFKVLDEAIYEIALNEVLTNAISISANYDIIIIEFARNTYMESFNLISKYLSMNELIILYLFTNYDSCISRNKKRKSHYVPLEIMESYFKTDDKQFLVDNGLPMIELDNNSNIDNLVERVKNVVVEISYDFSFANFTIETPFGLI